MDRPPELMSDAELEHALDQADADLARIETRRLRLVAAMDKSGYAEEVGARDMVQYLERRYRLNHYSARRIVLLARALPKYPAVAAALPGYADVAEGADADGRPEVLLRPAQAEAIVSELEKVPPTVPVDDLEVAEQELVRLARHLCPVDLRKAAEQSRNILDTDGPEPEEHKAAARETLTLQTADRGVKFKGYLANENAELLRTMITAGARPHKTIDGDPDPRSREKRQADALTTTLTLAATALDAGTPSPTIPRPTTTRTSPTQPTSTHSASTGPGSTGPGSTEPGSTAAGPKAAASTPASTAGSTAGSTEEATADTVRGSDAGSGGGSAAGQPGAGAGGDVVPGFGAKANLTVTIDLQDLKAATADAIGQTVYSNGLSAATIRRLACDAKVIPIVLGSNSEPLDVGRAERLVTRAIRRALNTRDRGCVVCGAPPILCDAHHLTSWIDGGDTKITNLVLLCRRHHSDLHHGHWTITITNGEVHVARPHWADPPPRPNPLTTTPPPSPATRPRSNDPRAEHSPPGDSQTDGSRADDSPPGDSQADGSRADDSPSGDSRADGSRADRSPSGDSRADGSRADRSPSGDSRTGGTSTGSSRPRISTPADDPWGGTAVPAAAGPGGRSRRWHADELTRAEAARFAVWGDRAANESGAGPPSFATI